VVCNPGWAAGQSTSISTGIDALPDNVGGVVFLLVDQPLIPVDLIQKLIQTHHRSPAAIIMPRVRERAGNPVLFDRQVFDKLKELEGDVGGRVLFESFPSRYVPWDDPRSQLDIDTPEDYQEIRFDSE
jgi:molybdenum cofactor cytidylyltransferase